MNLYLISQNINDNYNASEKDAIIIRPSRAPHTWCPPEYVNVELIGTANPGTPQGVILASYNAGWRKA